MSGALRKTLFSLLMLMACVLLTWMLADWLPIKLLDFEHYLAATHILTQRQNPYGEVEFFAPPWLALCLLPLLGLPTEISAALWLLINLIAVAGAVILSLRWLDSLPRTQRLFYTSVIPVLMPGALFSYITGQISPLVNVAVIFAAWKIATRSQVWLSVFALLLTTLKPHIAALPVLICVFELIRARRWRELLLGAVSLLVLVLLATLWLQEWLPSIMQAWLSGDYRGGPGLVSAGYIGLAELGVPLWVFLPLVFYVIWRWWREGFNPVMFALALAVNLLILPYSRRYDFVMLILPLLTLVERHTLRDTVIFLMAVITVFLVAFTQLYVLTPVLMVIALLLRFPSNVKKRT